MSNNQDHSILSEAKSRLSEITKKSASNFAELIEEYPEYADECLHRIENVIKNNFETTEKIKQELAVKRSKVENKKSLICSLPSELFSKCMRYVGEGNFIFVATVSIAFHECYTK